MINDNYTEGLLTGIIPSYEGAKALFVRMRKSLSSFGSLKSNATERKE